MRRKCNGVAQNWLHGSLLRYLVPVMVMLGSLVSKDRYPRHELAFAVIFYTIYINNFTNISNDKTGFVAQW